MSRMIPLLCTALLAGANPIGATAPAVDPVTIHVFHRSSIHFTPDAPDCYDTATVIASDNGREIHRTIRLPSFEHALRIQARVTLHPIPKDAASVHDKWDRAGNVRLSFADRPDVEIVKFITAYGGRTTHEVDVTYLAPLLVGECEFVGFIDTWVTPAWKMDFELVFEPADPGEPPEWMKEWIDEDLGAPNWVLPLAYETITRELMDAGDLSTRVSVPKDAHRVVLHYLVSGHCTDGRGADEFESKNNVITIDGTEVRRSRPWRDDCRAFREVNPYCRRWFDGSWSADFSRSGWCPGDAVLPEAIDVTEYLGSGDHEFAFRVEDVRPKDDGGHGYWRVSAVLVGWSR